jgi:3-hydroxybutyryl-CoA dehydrogenase
MHLVVLSTDNLKNELLAQAQNKTLSITWVTDAQQLTTYTDATIYLDLLFENTPERILLLQRLRKPVIINSVSHTLTFIDPFFIRINGWGGFLRTAVVEASGTNEEAKVLTEQAFELLGKRIAWVPDQAGFVTPRVISSIINEAYFALEEGVSTKEEIDTAMKLGTNYPYGPFEWSSIIGLSCIVELLQQLSKQFSRYTPSSLLVQESKA